LRCEGFEKDLQLVTSAVNVFSTISLDELMQGLSISGYLFRKEDIVNIFNYVDVDKSGALDFAEVKQLICSVIR
jgi:Ca2+-binding EF-hand superfamily protein